jgi:gamma-tubulin complex component 2
MTKKLYEYLLSYASVPYFKILKRWIYHGEIKDPSNEFMVEKKNIRKENLHEEFNDMYWEQCYTLREEAMPTFLASYKHKILAAGKYLNVIREYKREESGKLLGYNFLSSNESIEKEGVLSKIPYMEADELMKTIGEGRYKIEIDLAYHSANKALIDLIFKEQHLVDRLRSIKHYLFLDQSDFLTHFLDIASSELEKRSKDISLTKLQSLLDISLRNPSSVSSQDPYNENVRVEMSRCSLIEQLLKINSIVGVGVETVQQSVKDLKTYKQNWNALRDSVKTFTDNHTLTGYDAFTLNYSVKFPLTLILNMTAMTKYQLLFRHIFSCKYVEKRLAESWLLQSSSKINIWKGRKEKRAKDSETTLLSLRIYSLRSKMLNFVQQFMYYVCFEVLEPNWVLMEQKIKKATTVEEVLTIHSDFQDTCLKECMLTTPNSLKIFNEIMMTCKKFVKFFEWCISENNSSTSTITSNAPDDMDIDGHTNSLEDLGIDTNGVNDGKISNRSHPLIILKHYEDNFLYHLKKLIDILHFSTVESSIFSSLLIRLDYNQYYYHLQSLSIGPSTVNMQLDNSDEKKQNK